MKDKMIDEGEYTQGVKAPSTRAVIVVDRGWIFAGDGLPSLKRGDLCRVCGKCEYAKEAKA